MKESIAITTFQLHDLEVVAHMFLFSILFAAQKQEPMS